MRIVLLRYINISQIQILECLAAQPAITYHIELIVHIRPDPVLPFFNLIRQEEGDDHFFLVFDVFGLDNKHVRMHDFTLVGGKDPEGLLGAIPGV